MTIATCICTMNRPDELRAALLSLQGCAPPPDEIVVSDDSAAQDQRSEQVCRAFPSVRYQRGPRAGLAANRNACINVIRSEWAHFIDDDVTVPSDFYERSLLVFAKTKKSIVCGVERNYQPGTETFTLVYPPAINFWGFLQPANGVPPGCVVINASLFPTRLFERVRFDAVFKYGCEEMDITQAAISLGYHITVCPDLKVSHFPSPQNRTTYAGQQIVSRVYFGLKRQWLYRGSIVGALLFATLGIPRIVIHSLRREGWPGGVAASKQSFEGVRWFLASLYHPRLDSHPAVKP